jgi:lipid A 3-O-deacylase PagL
LKVKKDRQVKSLRFFYQAGKVLPTNGFLEGENNKGAPIDYYQSASLQYGIETDGRKLWQQIYGYSTWGFSFYGVNFFNSDELGTPSAIYAFIIAPIIKRFNRWSINYEVGFGLTYDWEPFDQETNPYQYAIRLSNTVFIDAGLNADIMIGNHFNFTGGFTFTHFSNGATRVPNMGINLVAPRVGIKYLFKPRPEFIVNEIPKYNDNCEFIVLLAASSKQLAYEVHDDTDTSYVAETYGIFTLSAGINRQISHKIKFGAGMDIGLDGSYNSYIKYENRKATERLNAGYGNKLAIGAYGTFELVLNRLSVVMQPGWYLYREDWKIPDSPPENDISIPRRKPGGSYQRIGLKYHVLKNLFAGINVRAYDFSIANYIEWNIGYRVEWH